MIDPKEAYQIGPRGAYQLTNKELQDEARMSQTKRSTGLEAKTAELDAEAQMRRSRAGAGPTGTNTSPQAPLKPRVYNLGYMAQVILGLRAYSA